MNNVAKARLLQLEKRKLYLKYRKLWIAQCQHINTRGERMDFTRLPFLIGIYKALEKHRVVIIMKAVQLGFSEAFIIDHLDNADKGLSIQYVLPKGDLRNRFVKNRINRLTQSVPYYKDKLVDLRTADTIMLKQYGKGVVNYVDSNSASNFVEFPGDALYVDEEDRCNQAHIAMAIDRISASPYAIERYVGNPSVEGFGIHKRWEQASQGKWSFKCEHCNHWQAFDWFKNVVKQTDSRKYKVIDDTFDKNVHSDVNIYCEKCLKAVDRFTDRACWVHDYPKREGKSFHISKINSPFTNIHALACKFHRVLYNETELQLFYNSDLGIPYTAHGSKVTQMMLDSSKEAGYVMPDVLKEGQSYAGVDVGSVLNVVIRVKQQVGDRKIKRAIFIGTVRDQSELLSLLQRYRVKVCVIDAFPELRLVENLKDKVNGMYSCEFKRLTSPSLDRKMRVFKVRRTPLIDRVLENFKSQSYVNPVNLNDIPEYYMQMMSNTRVLSPELNEFLWVQSTDPDHYHLTEAYAEAAYEIMCGGDIWSFYETIKFDEEKEGDPSTTNNSEVFLRSLQKRYVDTNKPK